MKYTTQFLTTRFRIAFPDIMQESSKRMPTSTAFNISMTIDHIMELDLFRAAVKYHMRKLVENSKVKVSVSVACVVQRMQENVY